jgi:hypothetical protein
MWNLKVKSRLIKVVIVRVESQLDICRGQAGGQRTQFRYIVIALPKKVILEIGLILSVKNVAMNCKEFRQE